MKNPFVIAGYHGSEYFCDRREETQKMIHYINNGHNIVLSAPRRVGKTGLVTHVFEQPEIKNNYVTVNIDIYPTRTLQEFVAVLGRGISEALKSRGKKLVDTFVEFLHSLKAEITFDMQGMPVWGIGVTNNSLPDSTLDEIFGFLQQGPPTIIAIDEFQQITHYPDAWKVEASLRSLIQRCSHTQFVFTGSHRHLMNEMFTSPARPFYASTTLMNLPLLPRDEYADFCRRLFEERGKHLNIQVPLQVYDRYRGITAYMQRIMNELFAITDIQGACDINMIEKVENEILQQSHYSYESLYYQLTERQRGVVKALADSGFAKEINSAAFLKKYRLPSPSSVNSALRTLMDKDLVTAENGEYSMSDRFFDLWVRKKILHL